MSPLLKTKKQKTGFLLQKYILNVYSPIYLTFMIYHISDSYKWFLSGKSRQFELLECFMLRYWEGDHLSRGNTN